jgi:hypothetical protein
MVERHRVAPVQPYAARRPGAYNGFLSRPWLLNRLGFLDDRRAVPPGVERVWNAIRHWRNAKRCLAQSFPLTTCVSKRRASSPKSKLPLWDGTMERSRAPSIKLFTYWMNGQLQLSSYSQPTRICEPGL